MLVFPCKKERKGKWQSRKLRRRVTPETNIEQFGYKQELRRGMGLWDVVMYGVLFMVIIAPQSIFGSIQLNSHGMTPLVYIIGFVAIMFTAMSYMRMSGRFPIAGSVYSYVQRGINPHVGFIAGWLILLDYILVPSLLIVMVMNWGTALIPNSPAMVVGCGLHRLQHVREHPRHPDEPRR